MKPIIQLENVKRSLPFGDQIIHILSGISFEASAGEWVAISGLSGSGKTTLLGLIGGIDQANAGSVIIDGVQVRGLAESKLARMRNEKLGIVFQNFNLIATMTAL